MDRVVHRALGVGAMKRRAKIWTIIYHSAAPMGGVARDRSGAALVFTALMLPVLLGFLGLSTDVGLWYAAKRTAQTAADAAAIAGAYEVVRGSGSAGVRLAAEQDAARNGYDPAGGDVLTVDSPPVAGPRAGVPGAVEAVLRRTPPLFFSRLVRDEPVTVTARAVAMTAPLDACLWALEPVATALEVAGAADVELGCGVYANSINAEAIDQNGAACLTAPSITVVGGYEGDCLHPRPRTGAPQLGDPLTYLDAPSHGGCDHAAKVKVTGGAVTLTPGVYCGGIEITGGAVTFAPGTYVLKGGVLSATGGSTVTGAGVTFYLTAGAGGHARLSLEATAMDLSAPTSGPYKGILFFQDRAAPESVRNKVAGNADLRLDGLLYFPTTQLEFAGGSAAGGASTPIVARQVRFVGNSYLKADSAMVLPTGFIPVALVE